MSTPFFPANAEPDEPSGIIFFKALNSQPGERESLLNQECGTDSMLRAEVDGMLQDHELAGSFLDGNAPAAAGLETEIARLAPEAAGGRIGPYKLLQQIGEGGCGVVWMAEQEEPVRRRVAVKVIKLGMDTKQVIARFEAERQALALMDHPNIAKVLDAGATDAGRPYFVMELVRGIRITTYCDQNNLPTEARLGLFTQVCQAVQHAHQKGIIHRDIKPSNILVTLHDGVPVPKVIDFGIAKATTGQQLTDKTIFTAFEQFIGTPAYMSPEQAEMSGLDIDTRSDIYALGVLLYELLTGLPPFDPKELLASGLDAMRRTIRELEPPRPSTRLSTMLAADVTTVARHHQTESVKLTHAIRGDLDWIVMKALEKDRTRRYETANGLAQDIQRHLNNEPVTARPASNLYRFRKLVRRNKVAFAAAGAVAAALIIGLGISTWMYFKEKQARDRAVVAEQEQVRLRQLAEVQEKKTTTEASKSRQVAQFLKDMLKGVGPSVALGRDTRMLREILDTTAEHVGKDLNDQPEVEAELRCVIGDVYRDLGEAGEAGAMFREALAMRKKLFGDEHLAVADVLYSMASVLNEATEGEAMHREALAMRRKLLGDQHPEVAKSMNAVAFTLRRQGKFAEAETMAREALGMMQKLLGPEHPDVANALLALAQAVGHQGSSVESEALHREGLKILRKVYGNEHPAIADTLYNLAQSLDQQERFAESEAMNREALAMFRKLLGNESSRAADTLHNLVNVLGAEGKPEEAEALRREDVEMQRKQPGNEVALGRSLHRLAHLLEKKGDLAEAETMMREAVTIHETNPRDNSLDLADPLNCLARIVEKEGNAAEIEPLFREALARRRKLLANEHPRVLNALNGLANILHKQGDLAEAETLYREDLEITRKSAADNPGVLIGRISWLAEYFYRQNKYAEAEPLYREALAIRQAHNVSEGEVLDSISSVARLLADWAWSERGIISEPGGANRAERDNRSAAQPARGNAGAARKQPAGGNPEGIGGSQEQIENTKSKITERAQEAERLLRDCLDARLRGPKAAHWRTADVRSRMGSALLAVAVTDPTLTGESRLAKFTEAEALLLEGHEQLQESPSAAIKYKLDAFTRIIHLYEAWDKPDKAAEWQQKLNDLNNSEVRLKDGEKETSSAP